MNLTTTLTSKSQITIPKLIRLGLGLKTGTKIDIFPTFNGEFIGRPKRKSNIMQFAGSLARLDNGKPWKEIREEAEKLAVEEWVAKKRPYDKNRSR